MGDGVLAYFGYPQAHEHDAERAVRARGRDQSGARFTNVTIDPRVLDTYDRSYEGLRKAGLPEGEAKTN